MQSRWIIAPIYLFLLISGFQSRAQVGETSRFANIQQRVSAVLGHIDSARNYFFFRGNPILTDPDISYFLASARMRFDELLLAPELWSERSQVEGLFREIYQDLQRRKAVEGSLNVIQIQFVFERLSDMARNLLSDVSFLDLCVSTEPAGATVSILDWPIPEKPLLVARAPVEFRQIPPGFYSLHVGLEGYSPIHCLPDEESICGPLDLWRDTRPVLHCDLLQGTCVRRGPEAWAGCVVSSLGSAPRTNPENEQPMRVREDNAQARRDLGLAQALEERLPRILESFKEQRRQLREEEAGGTYSMSSVGRTLDRSREMSLGTFKEPELAALRDFAEALFVEARRDLGIQQAEVVASLAPTRTSVSGRVAREKAETWLERIERFLGDLLQKARGRKITLDLCIVTRPPGARAVIHPPSYPEIPRSTLTAGKLVNVYLGLYAYEVTRGRATIRCKPIPGQPLACPPLDLWDDLRPVFVCDLQAGGCLRRELAGSCEDER